MLIVFRKFSSSGVINLKAPKGLAYKITSLASTIDSYEEAANLRRAKIGLHDIEATVNTVGNRFAGINFTLPQGNTAPYINSNSQVINIDQITKYLSVSVFIDPTISIYVFVYGELVKMSQADEIWEFITKATI